MKKNSHEIFADFYADVPTGSDRLKRAFNVHDRTTDAWARPKASVVNPTGTGKGNPIDQTERVVRVIHPHDPARAREVVDYLDGVCDELDRAAGFAEAENTESPCAAILRVVESSAKLVKVTLGNCDDPAMLDEAFTKTMQLASNVKQLSSCLQELRRMNKRKAKKLSL